MQFIWSSFDFDSAFAYQSIDLSLDFVGANNNDELWHRLKPDNVEEKWQSNEIYEENKCNQKKTWNDNRIVRTKTWTYCAYLIDAIYSKGL